MTELFDTTHRIRAINTTCRNLIQAGGILTPAEVEDFRSELAGYPDRELAIALVKSHQLKEAFIERISWN